MASVSALTDLTVADLWRGVKDPENLWGDVSQHTLRAVKLLLENRMHDELVAYLNAGRVTIPGSETTPAAGAGQTFGDMLRKAADGVMDTMAKGEQASMAAATGKADLAAVTEAVNNAEVAVQTVVAIRDRVVSAYQDIMRMPI